MTQLREHEIEPILLKGKTIKDLWFKEPNHLIIQFDNDEMIKISFGFKEYQLFIDKQITL